MSTIIPVATPLPPLEQVYLRGVAFRTYDALVTEIEGHCRRRISYYHGEMEIMSPSQDHERGKRLIGRMIETLTEELGIPIMSCGSTTFKDQLRDCGLEPDECYYVQRELHVRGKKVKLGQDPSPDLAVEVDITTSVLDRFPIYAALEFPEIWQYVDGEIVVHLLQADGQYAASERSLALPMISTKKLVEHLERCDETDETTWIRDFRRWVQGGMK
jgi:Uma2 family endonuclease